MATLNIEGFGDVQVDDKFLSLSHDDQNKTVEEITQQLKAKNVANDMKNMSAGQVALSSVKNIPSSAVDFVKNTVQPFVHPVETVENMGALGKGVLQKLGIMSGKDSEKYADAVGKFLVDRYGSLDAIKKTIATDPVGLAADVSMVLTLGSTAAARVPGAIGETAKAVGTVGRAIDPINAATAGVKAAASMRAGAVGQRDIARALQRDAMTPQDAVTAGQKVAQDRAGMATLADVGGENVQGLVERVSQTPGGGRTELVPMLEKRQVESLDRISNDLKELTGTKRTAVQAIEQTVAAQKEAAAPLYNSAYEAGDKAIWSPELERLSAVPEVQQAMRRAVSGWQRSQIANGYGAMNPGAKVEGGMLKMLGGRVPVFPNLQFWDYTKGALDDMTRSAITKEGATRKGRDLTIISQSLRNELDKAVPQYAAARKSWSGPAAYIEAVNDGKDLLSRNVSAEEVSNKMTRFDSDAEREAYRTGVVSSILIKLGNNPTNLADLTRELRSPEMRKKISAIMPTPELAQKWQRRLDLEVQSSKLVGRALKGSQTYRRLAEAQDASVVGDLVKDAILTAHRPSSLAIKVATAIPKFIRDKLRARADERVARILTSPGALDRLPLLLGQGRGLRGLKSEPVLGQGAGNLAPTLGRSGFQIGRLSTLSPDQ